MDHAGETSGPVAIFLRSTRPRTRPLSPELRHTGAPRFFRPVTGPDTPDPDAVACEFAGILSVSGPCVKCPSIRVPEYSSTRVPRHSSIQILGYSIIRVSEYASVQMPEYSNI